MTTTQSVHPYRRLEVVEFTVRGVRDAVSGAPLEGIHRHDEPEFGRRMLDLTETGSWRCLQLDVECGCRVEDLKAAIGPSEDPNDVIRVLAVVSSRSSKLRRTTVLGTESLGVHSQSIVIDRDDLGPSFEIAIRVVRTVDAARAAPGIAAFAGALLAETDPVLFVLEKGELPYTGPVRFSWVDFSAAPEEEINRHAAIPVVVRTDGPPTVLLNVGIPDFRTVLEGRGGSSKEVALRHALAGMVGSAVWRQLAFAALGALEVDAEGASTIPTDWKGSIARQLARHCYPDLDTDRAIDMMVADRADPAAWQVLVMRVGLFADGQARTRGFLDAALRAARKNEDQG